MEYDLAKRLADAFTGPVPDQSSVAEQKVAAALLRSLCEMGGFHKDMQWLPKYYPFFKKDGKWSSVSYLHVVDDLYPGANTSFSSSFCGMDELNHSGVFLWECTDFVVSTWLCDLLLNLRGERAEAERLYPKLRAVGIAAVFETVRSPIAHMFADEWLWDCIEESVIVDDAYYLYSVFTGRKFSKKIRQAVEAGADVAYLNSFLRDFLFEIGLCSNPRKRCEKWLCVNDALARNAIAQIAQVYASMDNNDSRYGLFRSREAAVFLSKKRKRLPAEREGLLWRLFTVMTSGRSDGEFAPGGLSEAWNKSCSGILSDGRYLSCVVYDASQSGEFFWRPHASALFHILVREWIEEK